MTSPRGPTAVCAGSALSYDRQMADGDEPVETAPSVEVGVLTHIGIVQHGFVREVSFPIERGAVTYLFGPNNSGKSTILEAVQTLGGGPRREPSWVIAYSLGAQIPESAYEDVAWFPAWRDLIADDRSVWFAESEEGLSEGSSGWLRFFHAANREPLDVMLGLEPRTCFTTAWGPVVDGTNGLVAWDGVAPDPLLTPVDTGYGDSRLMWGIPGEEITMIGHGQGVMGPPSAIAAMPDDVRREIEEWSDAYWLWETGGDPMSYEDENHESVGSPPPIPQAAYLPEAAPASWLLNPSRLIPTLETLIGPLKTPITVVAADTSMADSDQWPRDSRELLELAIGIVAARLNEMGHIPVARIEGLGFQRRGGKLVPHPILDHALPAIADQATALLPEFARHSPSARIVLAEGVKPGTLVFMVEDLIEGRTHRLQLSDLAEGLRLWHALAIRLTLTISGLAPVLVEILGVDEGQAASRELNFVGRGATIVVLDEPEQHLHPGAQREAARWLSEFAHQTQAYVVAATHSPAILSAGAGRYLHVERRPDSSVGVCELQAAELKEHFSADRILGFDRGEILSLCDHYLIVEGAHEQLILEAWFPDKLARTLICPMRGTNRTESVNLQLEALMRVVRMPVAFLVDDDPVIRGIAALAPELEDIPGGTARIALAKERVEGFKERRHKSWLDVLFFDHVPWTSPIEIIDEPDIIFYLDEQLIGRGAERLYSHAAAKQALANENDANTGIKPFLQKHFGLREDVFSEDEVRRMAEQVGSDGRKRLGRHLDRVQQQLAKASGR